MPVFETAAQLYTCFGGLLERLESHPQAQKELKTLELTVKFTFTAPAASMWLVVHRGEQSIHYDECDERPDIELAMAGDVAHQLWMGEINVMEAITKRQIVPIGPLSKMMILAPLIKMAIKVYPQHFQEYLAKGSPSVSS
jgi:putative sterol carrier protein